MNKQKRVITPDPDLEIREELVGATAESPFIAHVSASRAVMQLGHASQRVVLNNGDEKLIQTGLEYQFAENTFSIKLEHDARIVSVTKKYSGIDVNYANATVSLLITYEDLVTGELACIEVPYEHRTHQYYGFKYVWNMDVLNSLTQGAIVPGGTILADAPTVTPNGGHTPGKNANVVMLNIPEVTEDGVVVSEKFAKELSYKIFETRVIEFGSNTFPLNIYGDVDNYQPFPDIGEYIGEDSVVMVTRDYSQDLSAALTSIHDVQEFDPLFDTAYYVKAPGELVSTDEHGTGVVEGSGKIISIVAYKNPKFKRNPYVGTTGVVDKYVNGLNKYYTDIINVYENQLKEHYRRYKNNDMPISEELHRILIDAYAITGMSSSKIKLTSRTELLDIYRVEITVEYNVTPVSGYKLSNSSGAKGVIVEVRPTEDMPITMETGIRADIISAPDSNVGRMIPGRPYELYFNSLSRKGKQLVIDKIDELNKTLDTLTDSDVSAVWKIVTGLTAILDTEQHEYYMHLSKADKRTILHDIVYDEFYLYYKVSSKKKPYQVVADTQSTIYAPKKEHIMFKSDGMNVITKEKYFISPEYTILLSKTADNFLSTASAKTNHYGAPIGVGARTRDNMPYRNSPTKILSETESRLYAAYVSKWGISELKDRATSKNTHTTIYKNILNADKPTNMDEAIDRTTHKYGGQDLELIGNIFNASGIEIVYNP